MPRARAAPRRPSTGVSAVDLDCRADRRIGGLMAKKRVHEIAKAQGLSTKDLLVKLQAAGVDAKAAGSSVDEEQALSALASNGASAPAKAPPARRAAAAKAQPASPAQPKAAATP